MPDGLQGLGGVLTQFGPGMIPQQDPGMMNGLLNHYAGHYLLQGVPTPPSWRQRFGIAERRALRLFRDMYGRRALLRYLLRGYTDFRTAHRVYRVYRERGREIEVYQATSKGLKMLYRLCIVDTDNVPLTDGVMKRLWLIRADRDALYTQANVKPANG